MTKIKICGLSRPCDIGYVNEVKPDFAGFIVDVPKSRRNISLKQLTELRSGLDADIIPVGVFVNEAPEIVAGLLNRNIISIAQLHGAEDEAYIRRLRKLTDRPITKAFSVKRKDDIQVALQSTADYILLDNGSGGTGTSFDWRLLVNINRPWFLAGGLNPGNISDAIAAFRPYAVDLSSGVETEGVKDFKKIRDAVQCCKRVCRKQTSIEPSVQKELM